MVRIVQTVTGFDVVGVSLPSWPRVSQVRLSLIHDEGTEISDARIGLSTQVSTPRRSLPLSLQARVDDAHRIGQAYIGEHMITASYASFDQDLQRFLLVRPEEAVAVREMLHHVIDLASVMATSNGDEGVRVVADRVNARLEEFVRGQGVA